MGYVATQTGKKMKKASKSAVASNGNIKMPKKISGSLKDVASNNLVKPMPKANRK